MRHLPMVFCLLVLSGCLYRPPLNVMEQCRGVLSGDTRQVVVVEPDGTAPTGTAVRLFERSDDGWRQFGTAIPAVVGRKGLAPPGEKREGDGRTPTGVFALERGFGYEPLTTRLPYIVLTPDMIWIDDPRSDRYNTLVDTKEGRGYSFEEMRRKDDLYKYGIVVEYNTKQVVPGAGSAIFFHVWRAPGTPTAGCIATAEADVLRMLEWLDPAKHPVAVIGDACR